MDQPAIQSLLVQEFDPLSRSGLGQGKLFPGLALSKNGRRGPPVPFLRQMKRWYGYRRVRYRSLVKNALQLQLLAVAMNLRRALVLAA